MAKAFAREFYRSKEWAQTRAYCLIRDRYLCQKCGRPAEEVHHIKHLTPGNIGDPRVTLDPSNLVSLCRDCHMQEHVDDQAEGRPHRYSLDTLPVIVFDDEGNAIAIPRKTD